MKLSYKWNASLKSGIPLIDLQHKTFLAGLQKFSEACEEGIDQRTITENLAFLKSYAMEHLAFEEALMDIIHYHRAMSHKAIHAEFKNNVEGLIASFESCMASTNTILSSNYLMLDWFLKHVKSEDAALCHALTAAMHEDKAVRKSVEDLIETFDPKTGHLIKK